MTRPFVFRINAAELFSIVSSMPARDHSKFLKSFAHDLITLNPTQEYSAKVIQEAIDFTNKKRESGSKGGKQRSSGAKAVLKHKPSTSQAKVKPEQNTEQNIIIETIPPDINDVIAYCSERNNDVDPHRWFNYYASKGWKIGDKAKMVSWKSAIRTWEKKSVDTKPKQMIMNMNGIMVEVD